MDFKRQLVSAAFLLSFCTTAPAAEPPAVRFHSVVSADGVVLNVADSGPAGAPAVIFLHGIGQSTMSWRKQLEGPLAGQLRLVALDLRGHGDSGKPSDTAAYREACRWANDVRAVQDSLGLSRPVLVAWSFGGLVAMHYVRCAGVESLAGLVLVSTSAGRLVTVPASAPSDGARVAGVAARDMSSPDLRNNIRGAKAFAPLMVADSADKDWEEETVAALLRLPAYVRRSLAGDLTGPDGAKISTNEDLAGRLSLPLLVIVGNRDALSDGAALAGAYRARFPAARVVEYPTSGHSPFAEDAARFDADLLSFVSATRGVPPAAD